MMRPIGVREARCFEEVRLNGLSTPFLHNSVIFVPDMMTVEECNALIDAVDSHLDSGGAWIPQDKAYDCSDESKEVALNRVRTSDLGVKAEEMISSLITERVLPFFEQQLPDVALELFGQSSDLAELEFSFSPGEPAINRYTKGGEFRPHRDRYSITVYVTLSEESSYSGSGTAFWPQDAESEESPEPAVTIRPSQGGAVIFNGDVLHAGLPVESGVRHLFVSSFHLDNPDVASPPRRWTRMVKGEVKLATE
eukprot:TRINITY_DN72021_c0_g1_i1.p1 TRINITY_DN72021_c0_g1~~TRINITY_DN72021_c0_g1_i1.p1  ORF type:complete len:252 (-),score=40.23 TRINITY_DN72021_c0_g1_i1:21-776(-)